MTAAANVRAPAVTDDAVREVLLSGDVARAATLVIQGLGPEVFGFLRGSLGNEVAADDVFAVTSERIWRGLPDFRWQCSVRTWVYVIARRESLRFSKGARRRDARQVTPTRLDEMVERVRTATRSALGTEKMSRVSALRDELPVEDRTLLILRVDRTLAWEDIARTFLVEDETPSEPDLKREAARLRKRFQLVKERLATRAREEGLLS